MTAANFDESGLVDTVAGNAIGVPGSMDPPRTDPYDLLASPFGSSSSCATSSKRGGWSFPSFSNPTRGNAEPE